MVVPYEVAIRWKSFNGDMRLPAPGIHVVHPRRARLSDGGVTGWHRVPDGATQCSQIIPEMASSLCKSMGYVDLEYRQEETIL